jgi:hypothetical protein
VVELHQNWIAEEDRSATTTNHNDDSSSPTPNNDHKPNITEEEMKDNRIGYVTFSSMTVMITSSSFRSTMEENSNLQPIGIIKDLYPTTIMTDATKAMTSSTSDYSIDHMQGLHRNKKHLFNIMIMIALYNIATCCIAQLKKEKSDVENPDTNPCIHRQQQYPLVTKIFHVLTLSH